MMVRRWFVKQLVATIYKIYKGIQELKNIKDVGRVRQKGGGRRSYQVTQAGILEALDNLVDPTSKGDAENPLKWPR